MIRKDSINAFIIQTIVMRLSEKESLAYLKDRGFDISVPYYYRLKKNIQQSRFDRLSLIAKTQFVDQHLERIDQLGCKEFSKSMSDRNLFRPHIRTPCNIF
jgi:hypothetical protein